MNCIKPNANAKKYQPLGYKGYFIQPHPNAASVPIYGVRPVGSRASDHGVMVAGPFRTKQEAEAWIDLHPVGAT